MSLEAGDTPKTLTSPAVVKALLHSAGIRPSRLMGQNFLIDANILRIITRAAAPSPTDTVIEVGAGLGALTQALVELSGMVFALEADRRLLRILERELSYARNLVLVEADAARLDLAALWENEPPEGVIMVSNLPYRIAGTLLVDCLRRYSWIKEYTIMVQREVADRLASGPGSRDYSSASVKVQVRAVVERVANVSRNSFYPRPRVDSTILRLKRHTEPEPGGAPGETAAESFDRVVSAAFAQRRKKVINALSSSKGLEIDAAMVVKALEELGKDSGARAEDISPREYLELARLLKP